MTECCLKTKPEGASSGGPTHRDEKGVAGLDSGSQQLMGLAWAALEVENHCVGPEGLAPEGTLA